MAETDTEFGILRRYQQKHNLRQGRVRDLILKVFLGREGHVTVEELWQRVKKKDKRVGQASVYRALKIFTACGICRELILGDGTRRYEHLFNHDHHDHLICTVCGRLEEICEPRLEKLQVQIARKKGFQVEDHRFQLFGICRKCR